MTNIPDAGRTEVSREVEEATRGGLIDGLVHVGMPTELPELIVVRPVVEDDGTSWPGELGALLSAHQGSIVGFASVDPRLAAELAAAYASWRGDRGGDVVLIDGSMERPVIDRPLLEDGHEGYVDAVLYGVSAPAVARRTLARGVRVVTAGSRPLTIGRALDPARLREFAQQVRAGLALLVLPLRYAPLVAEALDALVIVDQDERDLVSAARSAREAGAPRVVCVRPVSQEIAARQAAPVTEPESVPAWPAREERVARHEETREPWPTPEEAAASREERREEPERVEAEAQPVLVTDETPAEPEETQPEPVVFREETLAQPELEASPSPFLDETAPSPFLDDEEPFVIAASRRPVRRRYGGRITAAVLLLVAAAVVVWGWLGPVFRSEGGPIWTRQATESELGSVAGEEAGLASEEGVAESRQEAMTEEGVTENEQQAATPGEETPMETSGASHGTAQGEGEPGVATGAAGEERVAASEDHGGIAFDRSAPLSGPGGPYVIYLSSQRLYSAAEVDVDEALRAGLSAEIVDADVPGSGMWHRVALVGGFPTLAEARNTLDIIKELGYEGAWIARAPRVE